MPEPLGRNHGFFEKLFVVPWSEAPVFDEHCLGPQGGCEFAQLRAGELEKWGRLGRRAPALEQGQGWEQTWLWRNGFVELEPDRHGVADHRRGEVGR